MLVLRPGALGDTLLAVPALRALRRHFARRPLVLAAHAGAARLLEALGEVDRGLAFDDPRFAGLFGAATAVEPIDDDIVAWLSGVTPPALQHARVLAPGRPATAIHCARYLVETLAPLGLDVTHVDDTPLNVQPRLSDEVLLHPGSGASAKNWPAARFAALIAALEAPVRMIVGEADLAAADAVDTALGRPLPRLVSPDLGELAVILAGCRGYVGNDSGVSHLAGLCGARTVVLFGATSPVVWRPLGPDIHVAPFDTDPEAIAAQFARG